jgi:predicted transcriptional regulator
VSSGQKDAATIRLAQRRAWRIEIQVRNKRASAGGASYGVFGGGFGEFGVALLAELIHLFRVNEPVLELMLLT